MAATKVQANWTAVSFNSTTITRVTNVSMSMGGSLTPFQGDVDVFPSVLAALAQAPTATVQSADAGTLMGFAVGTTGIFTATHKDAIKASGGDIVYSMAGAVVANVDTSGAHGAIGSASLTLQAGAADGITNPLSFTRV